MEHRYDDTAWEGKDEGLAEGALHRVPVHADAVREEQRGQEDLKNKVARDALPASERLMEANVNFSAAGEYGAIVEDPQQNAVDEQRRGVGKRWAVARREVSYDAAAEKREDDE